MIKKCAESGDDIYLSLLDLRNTPRDETGSPTQRLMGRRAKTRLPITNNLRRPESITPEKGNLKANGLPRHKQKHYYDVGTKVRDEIKER